jgi:hypothetical protein
MLKLVRRCLGKWLTRLPSYGLANAQYGLFCEMARFLVVTLDDRFKDPKRLLKYRGSLNSQGDEDGIIHEIFRRIGTTNRVFVEIGVGDGTENNTAFLASQGWTGYWIDADPAPLRTLQRHPALQHSVKFRRAFVTRENIVGILNEMNVPAEFDFLSIDIDYNTYHIWSALSEFRPLAVCVEYNSFLGPSINWVVPYDPEKIWDGSRIFGASLKALELLGAKMGYSLVGCDFSGVNAFFVREDLTADRFAEPFTSENHYEPPRLIHGLYSPHFYRSWLPCSDVACIQQK